MSNKEEEEKKYSPRIRKPKRSSRRRLVSMEFLTEKKFNERMRKRRSACTFMKKFSSTTKYYFNCIKFLERSSKKLYFILIYVMR